MGSATVGIPNLHMAPEESVSRFRKRAQQLRNFARATKDIAYRDVLLEWAEEFDRLERQAIALAVDNFRTRSAYYGR